MKIAICIQCRDNSERLYHKSVRRFYRRNSILETIIHRFKNVKLRNIFVLTTRNSPITIRQAKKAGAKVFIVDNEDNVLYRFFRFILVHKFDGVLRVCADNPFVSLALMYPVRKWAKSGGYDYVSFVDAMERHEGLFVEYISGRAIIDMHTKDLTDFDKEHVTTFIRKNPDLYIIKELPIPEIMDAIPIRLTVDTKDDLKVAKKMYSVVGEDYWANIYEYVRHNNKLYRQILKNKRDNPK